MLIFVMISMARAIISIVMLLAPYNGATQIEPPAQAQAPVQTETARAAGQAQRSVEPQTAQDPAHGQLVWLSTESVPVRSSPPRRLLLGFPGWEVARTEASKRYNILEMLQIHVFSQTLNWAKIQLEDSGTGSLKSGWIDLGPSLERIQLATTEPQ